MELYEMLYQRLIGSEKLAELLTKYKGKPLFIVTLGEFEDALQRAFAGVGSRLLLVADNVFFKCFAHWIDSPLVTVCNTVYTSAYLLG